MAHVSHYICISLYMALFGAGLDVHDEPKTGGRRELAARSLDRGQTIGGCQVCKDPNLGGECIVMKPGDERTFASSYQSFADNISSMKLSPSHALEYWTSDPNDTHGERGIIYRDGSIYESTDGNDRDPERQLDTNNAFDRVACRDFSNWRAVVYTDQRRRGGRLYLSEGPLYSLLSYGLEDQIASIQLRNGTRLNYWTWAEGQISLGSLARDHVGRYRASSGLLEDPQDWLRTITELDYLQVVGLGSLVKRAGAEPGCQVCKKQNLGGECILLNAGAEQLFKGPTRSFKDNISSVKLAPSHALQYWTRGRDGIRAKRGIIYRDGTAYQSTNDTDRDPEVRLDTDNEFDGVVCEDFSDWRAIVYRDRDRTGGRLYARDGVPYDLSAYELDNQVSSVQLRNDTQLDYWTWKDEAMALSRVSRDHLGRYSFAVEAAGYDPEHSLETHGNFEYMRATASGPSRRGQ